MTKDAKSDASETQIIDVLGDEFFEARRADVSKRVKPKRFAHIEGVAKTAEELARIYGVDERKARLAGILHDWDKSYGNNAMRERIYELGLEDEIGPWVVENLPEVLHGPSAAAYFARRFPNIPSDVIHAIKVHTVACKDMSDLDKVLYIADAIEPNRDHADVELMRCKVGKVSLDDLYLEVYKYWIAALLKREVVMHPDTIDIWNDMIYDRSKAKKSKYD